jgi:hypothetical protein
VTYGTQSRASFEAALRMSGRESGSSGRASDF